MNIVIVDDEALMLEQFRYEVSDLAGVNLVQMFDDSLDALAWLTEHPVDAVFLDIEMPGINGIALAKKLREQ